MIPNIFISSTIADLQYLRDGLRDAVIDLRYHPVMSEHGEVGYLRPTTAAESCYRTVEQCQLTVLIVGKRDGFIGQDGLSITHREYRAAQQSQIPTITFVEPKVLHYKDVFDAAPNADMWNAFSQMDNPRATFNFLDEISQSETYNAIIPFASAADAKEKLKLQLADFIGERLGGTIAPLGQQIKDILAEIKTLRNQVVSAGGADSEAKKYLAATRYLLNDSASDYRRLLELLFGDIDAAVEKIWSLSGFEQVVAAANFTYETVPDDKMPVPDGTNLGRPATQGERYLISGHWGGAGTYGVYSDNHLKVTESSLKAFERHQKAIYAKAKVT